MAETLATGSGLNVAQDLREFVGTSFGTSLAVPTFMNRLASICMLSALVASTGCARETAEDPSGGSTTTNAADSAEATGSESTGEETTEAETTEAETADGETTGGTTGEETTGAETTAGETTEGETGVYEGAECFELSNFRTKEGELVQTVEDTCETPEPCGSLALHCPEGGTLVDCDVDAGVLAGPEQADTLTCVLQALANGEDVVVRWDYTEASFPGFAGRRHAVWIVEGRWFHLTEWFEDLYNEFGGFHEVEAVSAENLAACLGAEDETARLACLVDPRTRSIAEIYPAEE